MNFLGLTHLTNRIYFNKIISSELKYKVLINLIRINKKNIFGLV